VTSRLYLYRYNSQTLEIVDAPIEYKQTKYYTESWTRLLSLWSSTSLVQ